MDERENRRGEAAGRPRGREIETQLRTARVIDLTARVRPEGGARLLIRRCETGAAAIGAPAVDKVDELLRPLLLVELVVRDLDRLDRLERVEVPRDRIVVSLGHLAERQPRVFEAEPDDILPRPVALDAFPPVEARVTVEPAVLDRVIELS